MLNFISREHKVLKKQTGRLYNNHFILSSEDDASVTFRLKNKTVCFE